MPSGSVLPSSRESSRPELVLAGENFGAGAIEDVRALLDRASAQAGKAAFAAAIASRACAASACAYSPMTSVTSDGLRLTVARRPRRPFAGDVVAEGVCHRDFASRTRESLDCRGSRRPPDCHFVATILRRPALFRARRCRFQRPSMQREGIGFPNAPSCPDRHPFEGDNAMSTARNLNATARASAAQPRLPRRRATRGRGAGGRSRHQPCARARDLHRVDTGGGGRFERVPGRAR